MKLNKQIISDLRKEYGDAFYLLDSKQFRSNYTELKMLFQVFILILILHILIKQIIHLDYVKLLMN